MKLQGITYFTIAAPAIELPIGLIGSAVTTVDSSNNATSISRIALFIINPSLVKH